MTSALMESGAAFETQSGTEAAVIQAHCSYELAILETYFLVSFLHGVIALCQVSAVLTEQSHLIAITILKFSVFLLISCSFYQRMQ